MKKISLVYAWVILASSIFLGTRAEAYVPIKATYNGLFYETNGSWQQSSGVLTLTTTASGRYSGRVQVGMRRYSFSGTVNSDGSISRDILRFFQNPLTVNLQISEDDPDLITGTVSDGIWVADLFADRAVFDGRTVISSDAGQYTMAMLGDFTSTNTPGGPSYGTITVGRNGSVRFAGTLADGTRIAQSGKVSKNGEWALYSPLYFDGGTIFGWVQFNGSTNDDLTGDITWIKPQMHWTWYYPEGFALIQPAIGSRYTRPPPGTKVLDINSGTVEFNGGNLDRGITNRITLDDFNRVQNQSANGLRMTISLSNGTFSGRVMDPVFFDWFGFRGVVLQRFGIAVGLFPGWDQTGEVWLQGE